MHSLSTAGDLDHFGGCFRQPAFSSSLLLKHITAWLMANKTPTPSECRLAGGKRHRAAGCLGSGRFPMMLGVLPAPQKGGQRKADGRGPCRTVPPEHGKGDFRALLVGDLPALAPSSSVTVTVHAAAPLSLRHSRPSAKQSCELWYKRILPSQHVLARRLPSHS